MPETPLGPAGVRLAGPADLPAVLGLYRQLHPGDPDLDPARAATVLDRILVTEGLSLFLLEAAWSAGCYKAMVMTGSRRASTHAFYRACGFAADEKTGYIAHPASWAASGGSAPAQE